MKFEIKVLDQFVNEEGNQEEKDCWNKIKSATNANRLLVAVVSDMDIETAAVNVYKGKNLNEQRANIDKILAFNKKIMFNFKNKFDMKNKSSVTRKARYFLYALLAAVLLFGYSTAYYISSETIEITIKGKERITTGSGEDISSKFIIYTENEVFENTDSWLFVKFNSADYQNKLEVGKTYKVKVAGWRVPFLSMYRNVVSGL